MDMELRPDTEQGSVTHALTIDVEEWFHAENMRPVAPPDAWARLERRLQPTVERMLALLDRRGVKATFFILGEAAASVPQVVRDIAARGHEIACHGWSHDLVYRQSPELFRSETHRAKVLLEDLSGHAVHGYRASTFSIVTRSLWALDVLADEGFTYDSSIAPLRHDRYGIADAPTAPHARQLAGGREIAEFPVSFGHLLGKRFPVGGGFFRLFPLAWTRRALAGYARRGRPAMLYLHPWEVDPEPPRVTGLPRANRFRHYARLATTERKLDRLLATTAFGTMADALRRNLKEPDPTCSSRS